MLTNNPCNPFQRSVIALLIGLAACSSVPPALAEDSPVALLPSGFQELNTGNAQLRVIYSPLAQTVLPPGKELMIRKGNSQRTCAFLAAGALKNAGISADYSNFSGTADFTCDLIFTGSGAEFYGDAPAESGNIVLKGLGILLNVGLAVAGAHVGNAMGGAALAGGLGAQGATLGSDDPKSGSPSDATAELYKVIVQRGQLFGDGDKIILERICQPNQNQCGWMLGVAKAGESGKPAPEILRMFVRKTHEGTVAAMNLLPVVTPPVSSE